MQSSQSHQFPEHTLHCLSILPFVVSMVSFNVHRTVFAVVQCLVEPRIPRADSRQVSSALRPI